MINSIPTPAYVVYEDRLRKNLSLIKDISERANVHIIMAFKANALWKTFPIISEYVKSSTASSLNEMYLSREFLGDDVHTYCPVYTEENFPKFLDGSSHITFNSLSQYDKFRQAVEKYNFDNKEKKVSCGIRINPQCSLIETDLYNPCLPGTRFGITADKLPETLQEGIDGFHFHALCESSSHDLELVLNSLRKNFGKWLPQLQWLNLGGGHLVTREGYDVEHLISLINQLHKDYPNLKIIMEPGSAFTWQTGDLITTVLDIVEDSGIKTAIIDSSFACHMPDCLEMPYKPRVLEALPDESKGFRYRLGGNSCLSGDYIDGWAFSKPLEVGQKLTFCDMNHYTTVKTTMFNGLQHPSFWLIPSEGEPQLLRSFTYLDYKDRMD